MTTAIKQQVKTRFLILSDTHSATPSPDAYDSNAAFRVPLPRADVLLHCGDLTMVGHLFEYEKTLGMLESAEAGLKLVIAGNHDISLDGEYYERKGAWMHRHGGHDPDLPRKAREMWLGERAQRADVTYLEEGTHSFTLENGARLRVYASPYQPEFYDFAFPYFRNQDRFNPSDKCTPGAVSIVKNPVPDFPEIDVMMTHGPPLGILDDVETGDHVGCEHLLRAARRCKPKLHCFGHIHEGRGARMVRWKKGDELDANSEAHVEQLTGIEFDADPTNVDEAVYIDSTTIAGIFAHPGKDTLMINASIMTVAYEPSNKPFVVDLYLEKAA